MLSLSAPARVVLLLLLIGHAGLGSSATEQGAPGRIAGTPAKYVIGLDPIGSSQDDAADDSTVDHVFMTNKAGTKYDCQLPNTIEQTSTDGFGLESHAADAESVAQLLDTLSARCFYRLEDWWTYELCYGKHVRQFHRDKETVTLEYSLGHYSESKDSLEPIQVLPASDAPASTYVHQTYEHGDDCDITGQTRQTEVRYTCVDGSKEIILSIKEPSTCHYVLAVGVPGLCNHPFFKRQEEKLQHIVCTPFPRTEQAEE